MIIELKGMSRIVFIGENYVLKIPNIRKWKLFLCGLLSNMQETSFGKSNLEGFCPVTFSFPGGWFIIAKRAREMTEQEFLEFDAHTFCNRETHGIPAEHKHSSFGWLNGQIVAIDYG
jgi:hypothetical protein